MPYGFSFRALHGWGRKRTLGAMGGELQVQLWEGVDLWLQKQYGGHLVDHIDGGIGIWQ
jgi:hypothetical protein